MNLLGKFLENPNVGTALYVDRAEVRDYIDGKPADTIKGYRYDCVLPKYAYERISVKVDGNAVLDVPLNPIEVSFENLYVTPYVDNSNRIALSFKASKIKAVSKGN